jgi:transcriptional regulator with XRE-family HTH domain
MATFARLDPPPTTQKNIEDVMRELGRQLQKAREKQGWTINDVAAAVGCSRPTVENAEAGKMRSRSEKLVDMADLFGLTLPDGVPSTQERRQAGAVKGRLVRDLKRQGASVISAPSKTEQVAPATAPANGRADEDWEVVPSQRNGLWKTGPTEDDWDGMTEETAMVVHARAKAEFFI